MNPNKLIANKLLMAILFALTLLVLPEEPAEAKTRKSRVRGNTLAIVNGREISLEYLNERITSIPETYREEYEKNKSGLLDQLIIEMLLIEEAKKMGFESEVQGMDEKQKNAEVINMLLSRIAGKADVTEGELYDFYSANKEKIGDIPFEKVKENIRDYLLPQKQNHAIETYIQELKNSADIVKNEKWLSKQEKSDPIGLIKEALNSGMPSVVDLGSDSCVPCKMMKPILEELKDEYRGKANILVIDIYKYRNIASEYGVRAIPTQIFFNENGKEVWRHEGFISKEEIMKKIEEMEVR